MQREPAFVGRGWGFPLRIGGSGGIAMVRSFEGVEQSIYLILSTTPGERPMRPEFGCGLVELVYAPCDATTFGQIAVRVEDALDRWEPRIDVLDVDVGPHPEESGTLLIRVDYQLRETYDRRNLVFPFYIIPHHEEPAP